MRVDTNPMRVLTEAERAILSGEASPEDVRKAIAQVDALGRPEYSRAIRRTLQHEANHAE